jgi:hypothetical protein
MAELGLEAVEDEMGVLFGDGRGGVGGDVVPEDDVVEGEVDGGTVREVGDDQGIWYWTKKR